MFNSITCNKITRESPPIPKAEIILLHGSFGASSPWYQEGGDFYQAIQQAALEKFGNDNFVITPFKWSGYLGCMPRVEAATRLVKHLLESPNKIYTIGHSHGGNVINIASQILELLQSSTTLEDRLQKIRNLAQVLFNKGKEEFDKWNASTRNPDIEIEEENFDQVLEILTTTVTNLISFLEKKNITKNLLFASGKQTTLIEECYLLATPVDSSEVLPSNLIIKQCFNLYSKSDCVQTVFGLYGKKYNLDRSLITNISVVVKEISSEAKPTYTYPTHTDLHMPYIGKVIFLIPGTSSNFSDAEYKNHNECEIIFHEDGSTPTIAKPHLVSNTIAEIFLDTLKEAFSLFV